MYKFFGWLNIALVVVITAPYWLRKANQWFFKNKNEWLAKLGKTLRRAHKPLAAALLVSILIHGWLATGGHIRLLHTGTLTAIAFLLTALFGLLFYLRKKPILFKLHKGFALASALLVIVHLLVPNLLAPFSS